MPVILAAAAATAATLTTATLAAVTLAAASDATCFRRRVLSAGAFASATLCSSELQHQLLGQCISRGSRLHFICQLWRRGTGSDASGTPRPSLGFDDHLGHHL
jgi:hypothetical protein